MTAGGLLREARQAAGVHIAALAVALKVPVSKLEALEADDYEALPDTVFVRALASSMCRTLKLDPAPVLALLPQSKSPRLAADSAGLNAPVKGSGGSFSPGSSTSRSVTLIVLALLVGAVVLIFLPRQPWGDAPANAPVAAGPATPAVEAPPVAAAVPAPAPVASAAVAAEPVVAASAAQPSVTERPAVAASAAGAANAAGAAALAPAAAPTPAAAASAASAAQQPAGTLVLRARGESWVQVKDATGAVALQRNLAAGESVAVPGPTPLTVVVGRADMTEVLVRGKPFDLTAVSRENVARFEVK